MPWITSPKNTKQLKNAFIIAVMCMIFLLLSSIYVLPKSEAHGNQPKIHNTEWFLQNSIINQTNIMNFTVSEIEKRTFVLERREANNSWQKIYEKKFNAQDTGTQELHVPVKAPSHKGTINYRIIVNRSIIADFTVNNHDPSDFNEYEKTAYKMVEEYCGNTYITSGEEEEMGENKALGLAYTNENKIVIRSGMTDETLLWVINHECGHILQHNTYDKNRQNYPIGTKRSITWLNKDLSPYYKPRYENKNGTGFSEKNADCIAAYLIPDTKRFATECSGNKGQATFNIVNGKTATSLIIHKNFAEDMNFSNTGFAVKPAICLTKNICTQKFEKGTVLWKMNTTGEELSFKPNVDTDLNQEDYFYPKIDFNLTMNNPKE